MFRLPVVEGADGADRVVVFADGRGMPVPLAVVAAGGLVGRVGDLDLSPSREEKDVGAHPLTVLEGTGIGVWVEEAGRGDFEAFGVQYGAFKVDKQPLRIIGQIAEREAMNGKLVLVGGGAEGEPGGGANREGFVQASRQGGEEGGVVRGGSERINTQKGYCAVGVDPGGEGQGKSAVGGAKDVGCDVGEGSSYGVSEGVGGVHLPRGVEPASSGRERGGSRGGRGGGGRDGKGGNPGRGGLLRLPSGGGRGRLCIEATGAYRVQVTRHELGDAGVASICEVRGLRGVWVGLGKGFWVTVADVGNHVHPWEVGIEGGAIISGRSWGGGFVTRSSGGGGRGLRGQGLMRVGRAYPM